MSKIKVSKFLLRNCPYLNCCQRYYTIIKYCSNDVKNKFESTYKCLQKVYKVNKI